jgi:hypothetical protein
MSAMAYPLDKLCTEILKYDRRIRYAGIMDQTGRIIAGGMRRGIPSLEPQSEDLRLMASLTIQLGTDKTWDQYFGKTQYTYIKRERVNIMTFNIEDKLVLISTEPDFTLAQAQELRNIVVTRYTQG